VLDEEKIHEQDMPLERSKGLRSRKDIITP